VKAHLLFKDRDFHLDGGPLSSVDALTRDLELNTLFNAMANEDKFLFEVSQKVILTSLHEVNAILYRQDNLKDCLKNPAIIRELYALTVEATESARKYYFGSYLRAGSILFTAVDLLEVLVGMLKRLRAIVESHSGAFNSEGFRTLFSMVKAELSEDFFNAIQDHLDELKFRGGTLVSAGLAKGFKGGTYVLRKLEIKKKRLIHRIFEKGPPVYAFQIAERDYVGGQALSELRERGINLVANALAQSTDHIRHFFTMLKTELAFFVGCLNLQEQLAGMGEPTCFPAPSSAVERSYSAQRLYDVCLALKLKKKIVSNDVNADGKDLIIVTGANEGGKSTFLRSFGLAQLMMQCGMFVPAETLGASICERIFTHYRRREDTTMKSGKLDEELSRMSAIVDAISPNSVVLFNESFSATNEREGSEIAGQIVSALLERRIKVVFVTHFYEFSQSFYDKRMSNALFLRPQRSEDGVRTFRLVESEPQRTSFGQDLYRIVFDGSRRSQRAADQTGSESVLKDS
jgi:DNA mismatch repair ATPase MutS